MTDVTNVELSCKLTVMFPFVAKTSRSLHPTVFTLSSSLQTLERFWPWYRLASSSHSTFDCQSSHTDPQLSLCICVAELSLQEKKLKIQCHSFHFSLPDNNSFTDMELDNLLGLKEW